MENKNTIEGRNPVYEALAAGEAIDKILVSDRAKKESFYKILRMAKEKGVPVKTVSQQKLAELAQTAASQGVIATIATVEYSEPEDLLALARTRGENPFVILCDGITDPHNLGAVIRTANACGAHGVIIPKNRNVGVTATVAKAAAGATSYTKVARVTNLAACMDFLKKEGLWIAGADMNGQQELFSADLSGPLGIVVGAEGAGVSRLVKEKCDFLVSIPMLGEIGSLNASVAAALLMYEAVRCRRKKAEV